MPIVSKSYTFGKLSLRSNEDDSTSMIFSVDIRRGFDDGTTFECCIQEVMVVSDYLVPSLEDDDVEPSFNSYFSFVPI